MESEDVPPEASGAPPSDPASEPPAERPGLERGETTRRMEKVVETALFLCGFVSIAVTAGIIGLLAWESWAFFQEVSPAQYLLDTTWTPLFADQHFGIWPLVCGTFLTSAIAIGVALPFGLLAAIYLSEFASDRARGILKPAVEVLAGVPTVVYGYFALVVVTPALQKVIPGLAGFNALSPGLVMGIMILPMISSLSEDAIYAVPRSLKEGAYALGADKVNTIFRVVLPTAFSGIAAAITLAVSRAIGETMIVTIAAGMQPRLTLDPRQGVETMTTYMVQVGLGDTPTASLEYKTIFVVGATLFLMTFTMNLVAQWFRRRMMKGRVTG